MRKWILIALALLLVAVIGGAALLAANLDAYLEENREWLAAQAETAVGRKVGFERIGVSFSGGLGVAIEKLEVADDPRFSIEPFLTADELIVVVRLWPALWGRYEIARIALITPDIRLVRNAAGNNTDSLGPASDSSAPPSPAPPSSDSPPPVVAIALADIRDGRIHWLDSSGERSQEIRVEQFDLEVTDLDLTQPLQLDLSAAVLGSAKQNLHVSGRIGPLDSTAAANTPFDLELTLDGIDMQLLADGPLAGALPSDLSIGGPVDVKSALGGSAQALRVRALIDASGAAVKYDDALDKPAGTKLLLELEGSLHDDRFEIASSTLHLDRASLATRGRIGLGSDTTSYDLEVSGDALALEGWDKLLPSVTGMGLGGRATLQVRATGNTAKPGLPALAGTIDFERLAVALEGLPTIARLNTRVTLEAGGASMPRSSLEIGGAPATLAARVADLAKPVVVFEVAAAELTGKNLGLGADSGVELLRELTVAGEASSAKGGPRAVAKLRSGSGRVSGVEYQQLDADLRYASSVLTIERMDLQAYQGKINATGRYDLTKPDDPRFEAKATLRALSLQQLASSLFPRSGDSLEGKLDTDIELRGRSASSDLLRSTLSGTTRVEIADGMLKDVNLAESALTALTGTAGLGTLISPQVRAQYPGVFSTGDTVFETLRGLFEVSDGRMRVNDMNLAAKDYGLMAGGSVGLDGSLNINGTLSTSRELTQSLIGESKTVRYLTGPSGRLEVPMKLGGSLSSPSAQPDVSALTSRAAQNAATAAITDVLNKKLGKQQPAAPPSPDDPAAEPTATGEPESATPPPPVDPLEILIRRGLEGLKK